MIGLIVYGLIMMIVSGLVSYYDPLDTYSFDEGLGYFSSIVAGVCWPLWIVILPSLIARAIKKRKG